MLNEEGAGASAVPSPRGGAKLVRMTRAVTGPSVRLTHDRSALRMPISVACDDESYGAAPNVRAVTG